MVLWYIIIYRRIIKYAQYLIHCQFSILYILLSLNRDYIELLSHILKKSVNFACSYQTTCDQPAYVAGLACISHALHVNML